MPVTGVDVTTVPTAVSGLEERKRYVLQNQGPEAVYASTTSSAPADSSADGFLLPEAPRPWCIELNPGESLYLWTRTGPARVVITEAA